MMRRLSCSLLLFVAAVAVHAHPARPLYEPPEKPKLAPPPIDLRGTTWRGKDLVENRVIKFLPDGKLEYGTGNSMTKNVNTSWKLEGDALYFEMNNQYREFKGRVLGDTIVGESWNKANLRWETKLIRDAASP